MVSIKTIGLSAIPLLLNLASASFSSIPRREGTLFLDEVRLYYRNGIVDGIPEFPSRFVRVAFTVGDRRASMSLSSDQSFAATEQHDMGSYALRIQASPVPELRSTEADRFGPLFVEDNLWLLDPEESEIRKDAYYAEELIPTFVMDGSLQLFFTYVNREGTFVGNVILDRQRWNIAFDQYMSSEESFVAVLDFGDDPLPVHMIEFVEDEDDEDYGDDAYNYDG